MKVPTPPSLSVARVRCCAGSPGAAFAIEIGFMRMKLISDDAIGHATPSLPPPLLSSLPSEQSYGVLVSLIDARLEALLAFDERRKQRIVSAMRFAVLSPGKRIRPLMTLLAARQCGGDETLALDTACAIEMIHAASLILDDLPCMDDATLRRGRKTTHRVYGEDIAILAAVGLLNEAYAVVLADEAIDAGKRAEICALMSRTVGPRGLIGGQEFDLHDRQRTDHPADVLQANHAKTGALLVAAAEAGAIAAGANKKCRSVLRCFATALGAAFQLADDLLDCTASVGQIGKDVDQDSDRVTVVAIFGESGTRRAMDLRVSEACSVLANSPLSVGPLDRFARGVISTMAQGGRA
jgi:geranylgeranyl diphosphate synthase, type II